MVFGLLFGCLLGCVLDANLLALCDLRCFLKTRRKDSGKDVEKTRKRGSFRRKGEAMQNDHSEQFLEQGVGLCVRCGVRQGVGHGVRCGVDPEVRASDPNFAFFPPPLDDIDAGRQFIQKLGQQED